MSLQDKSGMCESMQGDGTAVCLQGNPAVFTLSMHAANNFPARKQKSTLDVALPDGMEDDDYLRYCVDTLISASECVLMVTSTPEQYCSARSIWSSVTECSCHLQTL